MPLEVFRETTVMADPGQSALDDPAFGENDEAMQLVTLDDLDRPGPGLGEGCRQLRPLIVGVGEDAIEKGEQATRVAVEDQPRAVAVLYVGRMNDDIQQEAERVDKNVPLAALDLLARIVALRIDRGPPFCAPLALCASMMATVGLASRPAFLRVAM